MSAPASPAALVHRRRIVVCVGAGGVGKTTVAAALGLGAARAGLRALVLTIDPARRLADALGVEIGSHPQAIPREVLDGLGVPEEAALSAMMLDMKSTFDELVVRFADDAETRERIFQNPIYQHVSDALAGSAEYSAMEKVYELSEREDVDLIILDTPPSAHALDFLEAPERLLDFLDSRMMQVLLHPAFAAGRFGFRIFQRGAHQVLRVLERVSGFSFLEDVSEFLLAFEGMAEGFRERARSVRALLYGPRTAFVLAAGPTRESVAHATAFLERLEAREAGVAGVVLNRVRAWPDGSEAPALPSGDEREKAAAALAERLAAGEAEGFPAREAAEGALEAFAIFAAMVDADASATGPLLDRARRKGYFSRTVPELAGDVHDLDGLAHIADRLFAEPAGPGGADAVPDASGAPREERDGG